MQTNGQAEKSPYRVARRKMILHAAHQEYPGHVLTVGQRVVSTDRKDAGVIFKIELKGGHPVAYIRWGSLGEETTTTLKDMQCETAGCKLCLEGRFPGMKPVNDKKHLF